MLQTPVRQATDHVWKDPFSAVKATQSLPMKHSSHMDDFPFLLIVIIKTNKNK